MNLDKIIVTGIEETPRSVRVNMVYIDSKGRRERTVTWNKEVKDLKRCLDCFCRSCSTFNVNTKTWCGYKKKTAETLVEKHYWKPHVLELMRLSYG